jgi:hypothetical protein
MNNSEEKTIKQTHIVQCNILLFAWFFTLAPTPFRLLGALLCCCCMDALF